MRVYNRFKRAGIKDFTKSVNFQEAVRKEMEKLINRSTTVRLSSTVLNKVEEYRKKSSPIPSQSQAISDLIESGLNMGANLSLQELSESYTKYQSSEDIEAKDDFERLCEKVLKW